MTTSISSEAPKKILDGQMDELSSGEDVQWAWKKKYIKRERIPMLLSNIEINDFSGIAFV